MDIEKAGSRREEEEPIVQKPKLDKGKGKAHVFAPPMNYSFTKIFIVNGELFRSGKWAFAFIIIIIILRYYFSGYI